MKSFLEKRPSKFTVPTTRSGKNKRAMLKIIAHGSRLSEPDPRATKSCRRVTLITGPSQHATFPLSGSHALCLARPQHRSMLPSLTRDSHNIYQLPSSLQLSLGTRQHNRVLVAVANLCTLVEGRIPGGDRRS